MTEKAGQITHLDQNRNNSSFDNLAFMCFEHHDKYDSKTSQSKNYTIQEAKGYRNQLYKYYEEIYDNELSSNDYIEYLEETIQCKSEDYNIIDNKIIIPVDDIRLMDPKRIELELWNSGIYELIINQVEMRNRLPFHYSPEDWEPLRLKGSDKSNIFSHTRYINKKIKNFEVDSNKYISIYYDFPALRIDLVKKMYSLQFDFLIEVTIPSKCMNYKTPDIKREITKTLLLDFVEK